MASGQVCSCALALRISTINSLLPPKSRPLYTHTHNTHKKKCTENFTSDNNHKTQGLTSFGIYLVPLTLHCDSTLDISLFMEDSQKDNLFIINNTIIKIITTK